MAVDHSSPTTHIQPVETKPGDFKKHMDLFDRMFYEMCGVSKAAGCVMLGAAVLGLTAPLTLTAAMGMGSAVLLGSLSQTWIRGAAEDKMVEAGEISAEQKVPFGTKLLQSLNRFT